MLFSVILPSAKAMTLGKVTTWELPGNMLCRVQWPLHLANITGLPSATGQALGKGRHFAECLVGDTWQSGHLCRVPKSTVLGKAGTFAECLRHSAKADIHSQFIGKDLFAECTLSGTQQRLCRVPIQHSTKKSGRDGERHRDGGFDQCQGQALGKGTRFAKRR